MKFCILLDSDEILNEAENGAIPVKRGKDLSSDIASSESVIEDFLKNYYKGDLNTIVFGAMHNTVYNN